MMDALRLPFKPTLWHLAYVLIFLLALALRLWMAQPPNTSDDLAYFHLAHSNFLSPEGLESSRGRLALLAWIRMVSLGLGDHWLGYYLAVYAGAILSCLAVILFARAVLDEVGGVIFALLWATSFVAIASETRLYADVLGNGFALLGLYLALRAAGLATSLTEVGRPNHWALAAGVLLWLAVLTRETFFTHVLLAGFILWLGQEPRNTLRYFLAGVVGSAFLELILTGLATGDPFTRYRYLISYPQLASEAPVFQGYTWGSLITRYPRLLWYTQSAELLVLVLGLLGGVRWGVTHSQPLSRLGLAGIGITFGLVALALASFSPPVPLLRESTRYYLLTMPFVYWAATVMLLSLYRAVKNSWSSNHGVLTLGGVLFVILSVNLHAARNQDSLIRNGNNLPFVVTDQVKKWADPLASHLYLDDNMRRALTLFLPPAKGWHFADLRPPYAKKGLLLLDFGRMHYNVRTYHYHYGQFEPEFYRFIERYPIAWRMQSPNREMTELYRVGGGKIRRTGGELPWLPWHPQAVAGKHLLSSLKPLTSQGNMALFANTLLAGSHHGLILQLRFRMKAVDKTAGVEGFLTFEKDGKNTTLSLGRAWSDNQERELALWTWLAKPPAAFQLELVPLQGAVEVSQPRLVLLQTLAADALGNPDAAKASP